MEEEAETKINASERLHKRIIKAIHKADPHITEKLWY